MHLKFSFAEIFLYKVLSKKYESTEQSIFKMHRKSSRHKKEIRKEIFHLKTTLG